MKADIVIPTYNQDFELNLVLESLVNQDSAYEYEIFVVDDGSDKDIKSIVDRYGVNYFYQDNKGRSAARNRGAELGNNQIILFTDSDRIPSNTFVSDHIEAHLKEKNKLVVIGNPKEIYLRNKESHISLIKKIVSGDDNLARQSGFSKNVTVLFDEMGKSNSHLVWLSTFSGNLSIDRGLFLEHKFDEYFMKWGLENIELGYRLFKNNVTFKYLNNTINYHIAHSRDVNFYQEGISESQTYLNKKHGNSIIKYAESFILGSITLQEIEKLEGNINAEWLKRCKTPIKNILVKA